MKNQLAGWLGVAIAFLIALAELLFMRAHPFWSLTMFSLDIVVIYGLVVYSGATFRAQRDRAADAG